jgi:uncharacterized protein (TIGR00369 family)
MSSAEKSLQEEYAPKGTCFGCGPANEKGLRIRSFVSGDEVVCEWKPERYHEAFTGTLNGGIIGTLLDCHSNWAAAWHLMKSKGLDHAPCTVTAEFAVKFLRPAPSGDPVKLVAEPVEVKGDRAVIRSKLIAAEKVCAKFEGTFVAVTEGHPAYHRW